MFDIAPRKIKTAGHKSSSGKVRTAATSNRNYFAPVADDLTLGTLTSRFIPNDIRKQNELWRKIFVEDSIGGPTVELYKDLPWSSFNLLGIKDPHVLKVYEDSLNAIDLETQLPLLSQEFLCMGRFITHLIFDQNLGYWTRMIIHDPDYVRVAPIPIAGMAPKLDMVPTPALRRFASSKDPRDIEARKILSQELVNYLRRGEPIPLDPRNTAYIPRRSSAQDNVGTSIYTRILDFKAYEKALMQGSQAAVRRRLGAIRTVTVGREDYWEPSADEIDEISSMIISAEEDPVGAVVAVRDGVEFGEIGGGTAQDILKISDEWQFITEGKMHALGITDTFLTGEATYSTMEQLLSVFLERIRAHRNYFEKYFINRNILLPLARLNGFVKRTTSELSHRIRTSSTDEVKDVDLIVPSMGWAKNLRPVADRDYLEILEMAMERGLPVTLKTWAAFAGFNLEDELEQLDDDLELRKRLRAYQAATDPDYVDRLSNLTESGLVIPLKMWAQAAGLDFDELLAAMEEDVELRHKFRQWSLRASPEMGDTLITAIENGVPVPISEMATAFGLSLEKLLEVRDDDLRLRGELKRWSTAINPEVTSILESARDQGVPVTLEAYAAAAGINLEALKKGVPEDIELRKELRPWTMAAEGEFEEEDEGFGEEDEFGEEGTGMEEEGVPGMEEEEGGEEGIPGMEEEVPGLEEGTEEAPGLPPAEEEEALPEEEEIPLEEEEEALPEEKEEAPPAKEKPKPKEDIKAKTKKLVERIRPILQEIMKTKKAANTTATTVAKLAAMGKRTLVEDLLSKLANGQGIPLDFGYLLDGELPSNVQAPFGYQKEQLLEFKQVDLPKARWDSLLNSLKENGALKGKSWGNSIAEFIRQLNPYGNWEPTVILLHAKVTMNLELLAANLEPVVLTGDKYKLTYFRVDKLLKPPSDSNLMIIELQRLFQCQIYVGEQSKEQIKPVVPNEVPKGLLRPTEPLNIQIAPGTEEDLAQGTSVRQNEHTILNIMDSLPIWDKRGSFVALKKKEAEVVTKKVIRAKGNGHREGYQRHMLSLNPKKKQLMKYVLARLGLLKETQLDQDVANDIVNHLTKVNKNLEKEKLSELFMLASIKKDEKNYDTLAKMPKRFRVPRTPGKYLLSGVVPKR